MNFQNDIKKIGELKATFRHNVVNHKKLYPKSSVILAISAGQEYHENEKLLATINLINRVGFKKCTIMLGDTLQRHNIFLEKNTNMEEAHRDGRKLGDEWLQRNERFYKKLQIPYEIIRWDEWLSHRDYQKHRAKIDHLFENNEEFRLGFLNSINQFIDRYKKHSHGSDDLFDHQKVFSLCLEYLKEECAIIMPLWAQHSYNFIIYPSSMLDAMRVTFEKLVEPFHQNVLHWLSLRFKRK